MEKRGETAQLDPVDIERPVSPLQQRREKRGPARAEGAKDAGTYILPQVTRAQDEHGPADATSETECETHHMLTLPGSSGESALGSRITE